MRRNYYAVVLGFLLLFTSVSAFAQTPLKIGGVDTDKAFKESIWGKKAVAELEKLVEEWQKKGEKLDNEISALEEKLALQGRLLDFAATVLSEYTQVEEYVNNNHTSTVFDVVLLDRDCKACGSFHILDIDRIGADKVVAISRVDAHNEEARIRGVTRIVRKDYQNLDGFATKVVGLIEEMVG